MLMGGKMKFAGTGSAPLAPKAQMFVQTAFNCPVRQGYGLTETCGASCTQNACDNSSGVVRPLPPPPPHPRHRPPAPPLPGPFPSPMSEAPLPLVIPAVPLLRPRSSPEPGP